MTDASPTYDELRARLEVAERQLVECRNQRIAVESALRDQTRLVESIVNASPDILYLYDLLEKRNTYASAGITKVLGYSADEVRTMGTEVLRILMHPEDLTTYVEETYPKYMVTPNDVPVEHQYRMRHKDGTWRWIDCVEYVYSRTPEGRPRVIFGVARDYTERWRIDFELKESEARLREAQQMAALGHWYWNADSGDVEWSPTVFDIFHLDPTKFSPQIDSPFAQSPLPEDRRRGAELIERVTRSHEAAACEHRFVGPDGSTGYCLSILRGVFDTAGKLVGIRGVVQDTTDRKRRETTVRASEAFLERSLQHSPFAMWIADADGTIIRTNQSLRETLNLGDDQIVGKYSVFEDSNLEAVMPQIRAVFREHVPTRFEVGWVANKVSSVDTEGVKDMMIDVAMFPIVGEDGQLLNVVCQWVDVSERTRAENATKASEARYRRLFENMSEGFVLHEVVEDERSGAVDLRIVEANPACERLLGMPPQALVGARIGALLPHSPLLSRYLRVAQRGTPERFEHYSERVDGWFEVVAYQPVPGQCATIFTDITERKRVAGERQRREAMLNAILNAIPQAVFWKDVDGVYLGCNARFARAAGVGSPDGIIGKTDYDLPWPREHADAYRADDQQVIAQCRRKEHIIEQTKHADGRLLWVDTTKVPLIDSEGAPFCLLGVYDDITDRKEAEERLIESERRYRELFENMNTGFVLYEVVLDDGVAVDLTILAANEGFRRTTGLDLEKAVGSRLTKVLPGIEKDSADWIGTYGKVALTGVPRQFEQGSERLACYYSVSAFRPAEGQCAVTFVDITERRRVERERERLLAAIEQTGEMVVVTDTHGAIQYVNPAFELTTGFTRAEALGQNPRMLRSGRQSDAFYRDLWKTLHGGDVWQGRMVNRRKDGALYTEESTISPVRDASGDIVSFVAVKRDITEQLRLGEERAKLEAQIIQQQKLEAIGTLASGVAHEINNPINGVINYAQLIIDEQEGPNATSMYAEQIIEETERVATIARNLLAFSRQESQAHSPAHISDIIEATLSLIRTVIRHDQITLEVDVPVGLPQLKCRSQQIQQVIMNLLTNARDALNEKFPTHHEDKSIAISACEAEKGGRRWIRVRIADRGKGIPSGVLHRIWEPFFTTKSRNKGTGLGLSISHGIVKEHHGSMVVESVDGEGTTVVLELPVDNGWSLTLPNDDCSKNDEER